MNKEDIPHRVHFVGIGGVGMSGLAQHLHRLGYDVSGSDRVCSERTDALKKLGIDVRICHDANNIDGAQLVVRTSAVGKENCEVAAALAKGIPVVLREELLGAVFNGFDRRVAVCGTHGKTTVTAMLHHVLCCAGVEHAAFIGGVYCGNNYFDGTGTVIAEACEFNRSFLNLRPTLCVCLNVEHDHPDCYPREEDVHAAFANFFANVPNTGKVLLPSQLHGLCPHRKRVLWDKTLHASDIRLEQGKARFDVTDRNGEKIEVRLSVPGKHNVSNALATLAAAQQLGISLPQAAHGIETFGGVDRRWTELKTRVDGHVVLDYAHHPTELGCSVATAKSLTNGKVFCVFQPHTYSRTKAFWTQFCDCFAGADAVAYLPVYSAREKPLSGVNSCLLAQTASRRGINACFLPDFVAAKRWIMGNVGKNDVLLLLGAGDICKIADML